MSTQSNTEQSDFDLAAAPSVADVEDQGQWIHLLDRDDEPGYYGEDRKPVRMRVAGSYSNRFRRAEQKVRRKALRGRGKMSAEDLDQQALEIEAACVIEWEGIVSAGRPVPCEPENVVQVLRAMPWVRKQVQRAIDDHAAFFKTASGS